MRKAFLIGAATMFAACAAFACQQTEDHPPISGGPGGGHGGGGNSGNDAGTTTGDGGSGVFATFTGYTPTGLAADGDTLYVTLAPNDSTVTNGGKVDRVGADGTVTELVSDAVRPSLPVVSGGLLFYADANSGALSSIEALDLAATAPITPLLVANNKQSPGAIAIIGGNLYVAFESGGIEIDATPVGDGGAGSVITQLPGLYTPSGMASDGTTVFFAASTSSGNLVDSVPVLGGAPETLWSGSDEGTIGGMSVTGGVVYFTISASNGKGVIYGAPTSGAAAVTIANGLDDPGAIATTATYLYYTTNSATGGLYRTTYDAPTTGTLPTVLAFVPSAAHLAMGTTVVYVSTNEAVVRVAQ